jgi:hypothetical protein
MIVDLKKLAHLGARARLAELVAEMDSIITAFPDLGGAGRGTQGARQAGRTAANAQPARRRRRSRMTAAQRKEVSRRMKAYWAKRRAER